MAASKKIASDAAAPPLVLATPDYWAEACKHLVKKDRVIAKIDPQTFELRVNQTRADLDAAKSAVMTR